MRAKAIVVKPRNSTILESFVLFLKKEKTGFNDYSQAIQARIAFCIWIEGTTRRKHKRNNDFTSMNYKELERFFGRGQFNKINANLSIFDVIHSSRSKKQTRGYKLTEPIQVLRDQYLAQEPSKDRLIDMNGRVVRTLPRSISSTALDGSKATAWEEAIRDKSFLGNAVPINLLEIERLLAYFHRLRNSPKHNQESIRFYIEAIHKIRRSSDIDVVGRDLIPHRYQEGSTGRLYAAGSISLQNIPRAIRTAALDGSYDYDIENCHFDIFSHLAFMYGYDCQPIKNYLAHKSEIREDIAEDIGITVDLAKRCLLAVMFGARATGWEYSAIPELIGKEKAKELFKNSYFKLIKSDVDQGKKLILDKWPHKDSTHILNVVGKAKELINPNTGRSFDTNILLVHIIQGYEVKALMEAIKLYPNDITLLMHDGFVSSKFLNTIRIEEAINQATGMKLKISVKKMELPSDLDLFLNDYLHG